MSRSDWLALGVALIAAALRFSHSSLQAMEPKYLPDAIEYAVGGQRLATLGRFDLSINGTRYPSRYAPWFSLLLAPAYLLAPHDLGAGVFVIFVFALAAVAAAFMIGRAISGRAGACAAAAGVLLHPWLADFASEIMTDIPAAALGLWALSLTLSVRESQAIRTTRAASVGVLVAGAFALRQTSLAFALPLFCLLARRHASPRALLALVAPIAFVQLANWGYQYLTFGSALRSGYHFWCPVPYDYRALVWSLAYVPTNAALLLRSKLLAPLLIGAVGVAMHALRDRRGSRLPALALGAALLPIALFHLTYFFSQARFWLPLVYVSLAIGCASLVVALPGLQRVAPVVLLGTLTLAALTNNHKPSPEILRPQLASALAQLLPRDALIITDLDAVYLEPTVLRGTARMVLPATRHVEYASKLIARRNLGVLSPPPRDATDHRALGLQRAGAEEVFAHTADETIDQVVQRVNAGRPTYAALSPAPWNAALLRALGARVRLSPVGDAPLVLRLTPAR